MSPTAAVRNNYSSHTNGKHQVAKPIVKPEVRLTSADVIRKEHTHGAHK